MGITSTSLFPIRVLSERSGVGASTLRAWERRYALLTPQRTPKGHRLYSEADLRQVERIRNLLEEGHSLSAIADQLRLGVMVVAPKPSADLWQQPVSETLEAIYDFSNERVEAIYNEVSSLYPVDMMTERLIEPVLHQLGAQWQQRKLGIAEEHFYSHWVRNRLGARFHHAMAHASGPRLVCACLPGSHHDIGMLLFAISALTRGYRVLYLGVDLPLSQLPGVVERSAAKAVVMSARRGLGAGMQQELAQLSRGLSVPLMLGGLASDKPLPEFEMAGGIRLGSRIGVALQLLSRQI